MTEELLTFQRFRDPDVAKDIAEKLSDAGIYFETETEDKFFDPSFAVNTIKNSIALKLHSADFIKANNILDNYYKDQVNTIPRDYYLFDFSDEELKEILSKPDEWGHLDYQLAQTILKKERGQEINEHELEALKQRRKQDLIKPEKSQHWLILAGYFSAAASPFWSDLVRFSGFFLAVIIGSILRSTKKTLPDGQRVFLYNKNDRQQGKILIVAGIVLAIVFLGIRLYNY